jgi:Domain of unknown function (DUF4873)
VIRPPFLRGASFVATADHAAADDAEGYDGPAVFTAGDTQFTVEVSLGGDFQPIDGKFDWHGRLRVTSGATPPSGKLAGVLRTPHGAAPGTLGEPDLWGRYRITGRGVPPFPLDHLESLAAGPETPS